MAARAGIAVYQSMLRAPVYGLWSGQMDLSNFMESFSDAIFTGLKGAWLEGAKQAGIGPDELTDREISQMQTDIFSQLAYVAGFANFIVSRSKANGGTLASVMPRMQMWVTRWNEFKTRGYMMAKQDQKMQWNLGMVKTEHCGSCVKLSGKVKRASQWLAADIYPKHRNLECSGQNCNCTLDPTNAPMSKGRLPKIP
jgi:hypothetical protein